MADSKPKKKGFFSSLWQKTTSWSLGGKQKQSKKESRDARPRRPHREEPAPPISRRQQRELARQAGKGKRRGNGTANGTANGYVHEPLRQWPPMGMSMEDELSLGHAMELISWGVPAHKGHRLPVPHRSDNYYYLHATTAGNGGDETDAADLHDAMAQFMTLRILQASSAPVYPWETMEQPSLAFRYGRRPGTITLNHWTSLASVVPPTIELRDPGILPREVYLFLIFGRLQVLEGGLEEEEERLYRFLYSYLLRDPDKSSSPHLGIDKQMTDLIVVLCAPYWIDFTLPKNQVVTKFIYDTAQTDPDLYLKFFHQLLLSLELELRINSPIHSEWAKEKLMGQLPPKILWDLAVARRWRDNVRVAEYGETADDLRLRYRLRRRQGKMLKRFVQMMKWPNMTLTLHALRDREAEGSLLEVSSDAMAFFSGLILPGPSFPFLIMNSIIDIDPHSATDDLALLTHLYVHVGFQYRKKYTYWNSSSIVGKVLAPTCMEVAGWIGPARSSPDLGHTQIARIHSKKPLHRIAPDDVLSLGDRSDPLGPPAEAYPVKDYKLLVPSVYDPVDTVRVEMLNFKVLPDRHDAGPKWFDAEIQFAIDGASWPLCLTYDVSFINAWPCSNGPHPLFDDYVFKSVNVDELVYIRDWGNGAKSTPAGDGSEVTADTCEDNERVLVVEAFGVSDNEVLARAWAAHWGLSAVVADVAKTCMACAIREAFAATVTLLILVDTRDM